MAQTLRPKKKAVPKKKSGIRNVMLKLNNDIAIAAYPPITAYRAAFHPGTSYAEIEVTCQGNPLRLYSGSSLPTIAVLLNLLSNQNKYLLPNGYVYVTG